MKKLSENIWLVDPPNRNFPHSTCIFIKDEINCLIDSATSQEDFEYLKEQNISVLLAVTVMWIMRCATANIRKPNCCSTKRTTGMWPPVILFCRCWEVTSLDLKTSIT